MKQHANQGLPLKEGAVFLVKLKSLTKFEFNHGRTQGLCLHVEYRSCSEPEDLNSLEVILYFLLSPNRA